MILECDVWVRSVMPLDGPIDVSIEALAKMEA